MSDRIHLTAEDCMVEPPLLKKRSWGPNAFLIAFGIVLPILAVGIELVTQMCSSTFFDPIPTYWHIGLFGLTPIATMLFLLWDRMPGRRYILLLTFLTGTSIGVQGIYSVLFLPLLPFSLLAIAFIGLGLCGLAPYLALTASIFTARRLRRAGDYDRRRCTGVLWCGIVVGVLALGLYIGTSWVTNHGLNMAQSADEATSRQGIRLLRTFGSEKVLLRACYDLPTEFWSFDSFSFRNFDTESRDAARTVYYKVTGRSFNSVPPPATAGVSAARTRDFEDDPDVGGTAVNAQVRSLSMTSSRIDAVVDPDALTAYTEWMVTFSNSSAMQREARAEIALPPGGVVSRLTLWVNGEEREAAFSTRGKVREAYQQVAVVQRQDPVLVTTCGPDRVLMQCFPVPPNGGTMKVRIGVTSPLIPKDASAAIYLPPRFSEMNFGIPDSTKHSLLIESSGNMTSRVTGSSTLQSGNGHHLISATLPNETLSKMDSAVTCTRNSSVTRVWTPDRVQPNRYAVVQTLASRPDKSPKKVVVVVDGSMRMRQFRNEIAESLESLPTTGSMAVLAAGDDVQQLTPMQAVNRQSIGKSGMKIRQLKYVGGSDNRAALLRACDLAAGRDGVVVWIHGPQPFTTGTYSDQILQMCERLPGAVNIISVSAVDGRNGFLTESEKTGAVSILPRLGTLKQDLQRLFSSWGNSTGALTAVRERVPLGQVGNAKRGNSHLGRLWVKEEVSRLCRSGNKHQTEAADLAGQYQLVTPVSGAVVLETKQQYDQAGLKPVDPASTPEVVPEPSTWIMLAAGMLIMVYMVRRRKCANTVQIRG